MTTPTEQAMRAAEGLIADATVGDSVVTAAVRRAAARIIDTAAGLPELLAERDALREALELAQPHIRIEAGLVHKTVAAALALGKKAHP